MEPKSAYSIPQTIKWREKSENMNEIFYKYTNHTFEQQDTMDSWEEIDREKRSKQEGDSHSLHFEFYAALSEFQ